MKSRMRAGAPAAGWMEARSKLQHQLDTLITKTSAKITKYGTVHAVEPKVENVQVCDEETEEKERAEPKKLEINPNIKSLIKTVANEIQKSFSSKNIAAMNNNVDPSDDTKIDENNNTGAEENPYWRNINLELQARPQIDMEAPIDFDYTEPGSEEAKVKFNEEEEEDEKEEESKKEEDRPVPPTNTSIEDPVDFNSPPSVLDASAARSKAKLMRKTSTERRLPASVLHKRKAAEKLKEILNLKTGDKSNADKSNSKVIEQIKKELADASLQVDMSNTENDIENLNDEDKAELIAKQISKMESGYVMSLLKKIETGILDISVPMLLPFLSLQVKLDLGRNIYKGLGPDNKKRVVKENFINDMIDDITDIALLQEVIERTQDKINMLNLLKDEKTGKIDLNNYFNIEEDSFDLGPIRQFSPLLREEQYSPICGRVEPDPVVDESEQEESAEEIQDKNEKEVEEIPSKPDSTKKLNKARADSNASLSLSDNSDEDYNSSEYVSMSEEDSNKKDEKCEEYEKEKSDDDEGICTESEATDRKEAKPESKEKVIKQKLLSIIEQAKVVDQKRPARNFGRNFEFQNIQLKPIVPNDRRPAKAKRMDDLWTQTLCAKQKFPVNNEPSVPRPKVPWTMKKNTQPEKKEEGDKEMKKLEKSKNSLETTKPVIAKENQNFPKEVTEKKETKPSEDKEQYKKPTEKERLSKVDESSFVEKEELTQTDSKNVEPIQSNELSSSEDYKDEIMNIEEKLSTQKSNIEKERMKMEAAEKKEKIQIETAKKEAAIKAKEEEDKMKKEASEKEAARKFAEEKAASRKAAEEKETARKVAEKEAARKAAEKEAARRAEDAAFRKAAEREAAIKASQERLAARKAAAAEEAARKTAAKHEADQKAKEEANRKAKEEEGEATKKITVEVRKEVPSTPTVRRRGDTFTVVLPLARTGPAPPPPAARPPPPPMSPPVPVSRVKDLESENKLKLKEESESEYETDEEEESEYEWTEEDEEEEEEEDCSVQKEGWENIMSSAGGPTTFKAEYCITVGK